MSDPIKPKKPRALPRAWKRILDLQRGDLFYVGKKLVQKTGFFTAREFENDSCFGRPLPTGDLHVLWPWTKVKTTQLVRDQKPGGKSSADVLNPVVPAPTEPPAQVAASEPNNDNNVTGPTS